MKLTLQEKKWRAESDADTLSRAAMETANNMLRAVGKKTTKKGGK